MKLKVMITREVAGYPKSRKIYLDGRDYVAEPLSLSRRLTRTTSDKGGGILSESSKFWRGSAETPVMEFGSKLDIEDYNDANAFIAELQRRVTLVATTFEKLYPVHHSVAEADIVCDAPTSSKVSAELDIEYV